MWDIVDAYPQPQVSGWSREQCVDWFNSCAARYKPDGIIFPTQRMADDCATDLPHTTIYHHYRPGIKLNPIRERVRTVGYEGGSHYLGQWRNEIERQCRLRGWEFVVNPQNLADVDIVLAFRCEAWNGYAQRHWKSNVKLANAHGSGTPFIGHRECGYIETASGLECWADSDQELECAFDLLSDYEQRKLASTRFIHHSITRDDCAKQLEDFLRGIQK